MKQNIALGLILILLIWNSLVSWRNNTIVNELYEYKQEQLDVEDKKIKAVQDSLTSEIEKREKKVKTLEEKLNKKINFAAKNNKKYESKKTNAIAVTDADSLANILSNRYQ